MIATSRDEARSRTPRATWLLLLLLCQLLSLLAVAPPARGGEEVVVDGVLRIRNPASAPGGVERWRLEELWRVGADDSQLLIGLPTRVTTDAAGRIYVLDAQLNQVHVFSPDGELLRSLFREGEGPGEIVNPSDLVVAPDGSVGVLQEYPGKVVRLDPAGNPLPSIHPGGDPEAGGWALLMTGRARADQLVLCGQMTRRDAAGVPTDRQFLASFGPDGRERACYLEILQPDQPPSRAPHEQDFLKPHLTGWDVGPDGRVFLATDWDRYEIEVFRPDGTVDRVLTREHEPWRRTAEDRSRLHTLFGAGGGPGDAIELAAAAPAIALLQFGIQVRDDGELWVLPSRGTHGQPAGVLGVFDVFDAAGHLRRQVEIHCPGDPHNDGLRVLSDDRVIRIRRFVDAFTTSLGPGALPPGEGEDEAPAVICYRVLR